ncbi:MAG: hypothetical protein K0Q77_67 [Anaerosporomusa subterranea]|jgi:hypothetical protein|nr:hypothetical protein [Anaerosporomusa subterranea]
MTNDLISQIEQGKYALVRSLADGLICEAWDEQEKLLHLAKLGQQRDWIPVTPETMPEPGEKVLILHMGIVCEAINSLYEDHKSFYVELTDEIVPYEKISLWMKRPPIPALPEQGER